MKKILSLAVASLALALSFTSALAQPAPVINPVWQKLPVSWISSLPASGTAGGFATASDAPVVHSNGQYGWNATLYDTSAAIDISNSWARQAQLVRSVTLDTADTFPLLKFKPVHNHSAGIDTMRMAWQSSKDGVLWTSLDSMGYSPHRNTLEWGLAFNNPADTTISITSTIPAAGSSPDGYQWAVDIVAARLNVGSNLMLTSRANLMWARYIRVINKRDISYYANNSAGGTPAKYNIEVYLYSVPPFTSTGLTAR